MSEATPETCEQTEAARRLDSLLDEQSQRWQADERIFVEDYLALHPGLRDNPEGVLDLIYQEILLREQKRDTPPLDEYVRRFPHFADQLRLQFHVHAAMAGTQLLNELTRTDQPISASPSAMNATPVSAWGLRILRVVRQGIQLVVAHDCQGIPFFDHGPDDFKHLSNLRATVDEVAQKDHLAFGMAVDALGFLVAEGFEQLNQFIGVAVNVADQVVHEFSCLSLLATDSLGRNRAWFNPG